MVIILKKRHVIVLCILLAVLTISYASAADNGTDVVKQQNDDIISMEEDEISLSSAAEESVAVISENNSSVMTNDVELLGSSENDTVLTAPETKEVLSTCVNVTPLGSSAYKTPTKQQRTFNIGGFKVVLGQSQYKKLYKISGVEDEFFDYGYNDYYYVGEKFRGYFITSTGLRTDLMVKTNKFVKVKLTRGNKVYTKKSRVYFIFSYGQGQNGVPYRYMMGLVHHFETYDLSYDGPGKVLGSNGKYFGKCKHATVFTKLNKAKLTSINYFYKKYNIY